MRALKATQQMGRRMSLALAGTLVTSLMMMFIAGDVYVALGERRFLPDSSAGPHVTNT